MVTANEVKFIKQQKIAVRHATINIIRAIVLMKRADNTLNFADNSLEGTDELLIIQDIGILLNV